MRSSRILSFLRLASPGSKGISGNFGNTLLFIATVLLAGIASIPLETGLSPSLLNSAFWLCLFFLLTTGLTPWFVEVEAQGILSFFWLYPLPAYQIFFLLALRYALSHGIIVLLVSLLATILINGQEGLFLKLAGVALLGLFSTAFIALLIGFLTQNTLKKGNQALLSLLLLPFYLPTFLLAMACWGKAFEGIIPNELWVGLLGALGFNVLLCTVFGGILVKQHLAHP